VFVQRYALLGLGQSTGTTGRKINDLAIHVVIRIAVERHSSLPRHAGLQSRGFEFDDADYGTFAPFHFLNILVGSGQHVRVISTLGLGT
jgi:hypothetical protein